MLLSSACLYLWSVNVIIKCLFVLFKYKIPVASSHLPDVPPVASSHLPDVPPVADLRLKAVIYQESQPILAKFQHNYIWSNEADQLLDLKKSFRVRFKGNNHMHPMERHIPLSKFNILSMLVFKPDLGVQIRIEIQLQIHVCYHERSIKNTFYLFCLDLRDMGDPNEEDLRRGSISIRHVQHCNIVPHTVW